MNNFQLIERSRAVDRVIEHLHLAHAHLHAAQHQNIAFNLGLDLPPEKPIVDAIAHCTRVDKQPPEPTA